MQMLESFRAVLGMAARTCVAYGRASTPAPTVVPADACRPPVSSSWARQQTAHVCCIRSAPRAPCGRLTTQEAASAAHLRQGRWLPPPSRARACSWNSG